MRCIPGLQSVGSCALIMSDFWRNIMQLQSKLIIDRCVFYDWSWKLV